MAGESQTPRITQIQVRVDCNGCVQKIKKALNGINGIHDLHVDFCRQKLTIIGWADPEKIVKAIKKTRKNVTICSNTELTSPSQPTEPEPQGSALVPDATPPQPAEVPRAQAGRPAEPLPEQPPPEATSPTPTESSNARQQRQSTAGKKDVGEVHVIHHHLPNCVNRFSSGHSYVRHWDRYHNTPVFLQQPPQPVYVTHGYNTYVPSPYVTEYEYVRSPSRHTHYHCMEHYRGDYPTGNVSITSMFSDDSPNACSIV